MLQLDWGWALAAGRGRGPTLHLGTQSAGASQADHPSLLLCCSQEVEGEMKSWGRKKPADEAVSVQPVEQTH